MPRVALFDLGIKGLNKDLPPEILPPEFISDARNVRVSNRKISRVGGRRSIYATVPIAPYATAQVEDASNNIYWVVMGLRKAYVWDGVSWRNITRQSAGADVDYTGNANTPWILEVHERLLYATNGVDPPQVWVPGSVSIFQDLPNWPAGVTAKYLKGFHNYLMAFDITEGGTRYPTLLRWGTPVGAGEYPASWDYTDPSKDSGRIALSQTPGGIKTADVMGDKLLVYKTDSVWQVSLKQSIFSFEIDPLITDMGAIGPRAVVQAINGGAHVVFGPEDVVIITPQGHKSLLEERLRTFLYQDMDSSNFTNSICVAYPAKHEVWICYPQAGNTYPNKALIWNWVGDSFGTVDLGGFSDIVGGTILESATTWDSAVGTWDSQQGVWDKENLRTRQLVACDPTNSKLFLLDDTNQFDGVDYESFIERIGLGVLGRDGRSFRVRPDVQKLLTELWLDMTGASVQVQILTQRVHGDAITASSAQTFTPGTNRKIDTTATGGLLGYRVKSTSGGEWSLQEVVLNVRSAGIY